MVYISCILFCKNPQSPRYRLSDIYTLAIPLPNSSPHIKKKKKKEKKDKKRTYYRKKSRNTIILTILRNNTTTNLLWSSIERQNCLSTVLPWGGQRPFTLEQSPVAITALSAKGGMAMRDAPKKKDACCWR